MLTENQDPENCDIPGKQSFRSPNNRQPYEVKTLFVALSSFVALQNGSSFGWLQQLVDGEKTAQRRSTEVYIAGMSCSPARCVSERAADSCLS